MMRLRFALDIWCSIPIRVLFREINGDFLRIYLSDFFGIKDLKIYLIFGKKKILID